MKKKLAVLLAGVLCITSFAVGVMSKDLVEKIEAEIRGDFDVVIDGKRQVFKNAQGEVVYPILYEGTTYLPIRAIGELMGKTVYWYQDEKKIELVEQSTDILVTDADVIVDGADKTKTEKVRVEKVAEPVVTEEIITVEEAKKIALDKAGLKENDVVFTKAKLDRDDGQLYYEIDFKTEEAKYDAEINAVTGAVKEWEVEEIKKAQTVNTSNEAKITVEEAKKIALDKAGLKENDVVFTKAKLDHDDGRKVYEIEFRKDRIEYEAEINAETGAVIEWKTDHHD